MYVCLVIVPCFVVQRFYLQSIPAPLIWIGPEQRVPSNVFPCVSITNVVPCLRQGGNCDWATSSAQTSTLGCRHAKIDRNSCHLSFFLTRSFLLLSSSDIQLHRLRRIILLQ